MATISLTDQSSAIAAAQRQQQLAILMQEQAQQPLQAEGSYRGIQAHISPLAGLAKLLQQYTAMRNQSQAVQQESDLRNAQQKQRVDAVNQYSSGYQDNPGFTPTGPIAPELAAQNANSGLLGALQSRLGLGGNSPAPTAPPPPPQAIPAPPQPDPTALPAGGDPTMATPPAPVPVTSAPLPPVGAPPPTPDAAPPAVVSPANIQDNLGTLADRTPAAHQGAPIDAAMEHPTTRGDQKQMALQMMASNDPMLSKLGESFYSTAVAKEQEDTTRAGIAQAIITSPSLDKDQQHDLLGLVLARAPVDKILSAYTDATKKEPTPADLKTFQQLQSTGEIPEGTTFLDWTRANANAKSPYLVGPAGSRVLEKPQGLPGGDDGSPTLAGGPPVDLAGLVKNSFPAATITSTLRTPAQNAAANGVPNSAHQQPNGAVDFTLSSEAAMRAARDHINATQPGVHAIYEGPGAANSTGPHVHIAHVAPPAAQTSGDDGGLKTVANIPGRPASQGWQPPPGGYPHVNAAVLAGKLDPSKVNSRTAPIYEQLFTSNPNIDAVQAHAIAQGAAARVEQTTLANMQALPHTVQNVMEAGKALNYPDLQWAGQMERWVKGQVNDPQLANYMSQRNDATLSIAAALRGGQATEQAIRLEDQAHSPTYSPKAYEGWMRGQLTAALPKLAANLKYDHSGDTQHTIDMVKGLLPSLAGGAKPPPGSDPKAIRAAADAILAGH